MWGIRKQFAAGECIVGSCMVSAADWMFLGDWMGCVWIGKHLAAWEWLVGSCMVNATEWMLLGDWLGCVGGLGNSWLQESAYWGASWWVLLTECYWEIGWNVWGDWEIVGCKRVHCGELHGECCWMNVTGRLDGMCGGIGKQLAAGECILGSFMVSAADWMLLGDWKGMCGGIGKHLAAGECILGSFMVSAADWMLLGDWM